VLLRKWLDAGLDAASCSTPCHGRLHCSCAAAIRRARKTLRVVIAAEVRPGRRRLARLGMLPGASTALRLLLPVYRLRQDLVRRSAA
jgi:hypothetical protein